MSVELPLGIDELISNIRKKIEGEKALALVSGGVDSVTSAVLAYKALGDKVKPVFIDTGFMRLGEPERVKSALSSIMNIAVYDYSGFFYEALKGRCDAEEKRRVFREVFYDVVERIALEEDVKYIIQGTIASDVIETVGGIKTQHNVLDDIGHNPFSKRGLKVIEPLKEFYKDEVREIALRLGVPDSIVYRQPFPGPGLLVRLLGCFNKEYLDTLKLADRIVEDSLSDLGLSQYFAAVWRGRKRPLSFDGNSLIMVYEDVKATGVKGDARHYGVILGIEMEGREISMDLLLELSQRTIWKYPEASRVVFLLKKAGSSIGNELTVSIRAVVTEDFMTADVARIPLDRLRGIADKIIELDGVAEVVYDITPKPPATIEYE